MIFDTKRIKQSENFQRAIMIAVIVIVVLGFWFGARAVLRTEIFPALAVVSGSMCIPYDGACDGWTHPFDRTLHVGDIIVIQGVDPKDLNANYPNSDIIVFHSPQNPDELIVHRIISTKVVNDVTYFLTKGDGNGNPWPQTPQSGLDSWDRNNPPGVSQDLILGKVIMRVPWIGWIALKMQQTGANNLLTISIIVVLIILLIIIEIIAPKFKRKNTQPNQVGHMNVPNPFSKQIYLKR